MDFCKCHLQCTKNIFLLFQEKFGLEHVAIAFYVLLAGLSISGIGYNTYIKLFVRGFSLSSELVLYQRNYKRIHVFASQGNAIYFKSLMPKGFFFNCSFSCFCNLNSGSEFLC